MKDSHQRAMVDGKQRRAREIIWALEFDGHRTRCRPEGDAYVVELTTGGSSWLYVTQGTDPQDLLRRLVRSKLVVDRINARVSVP